jgi:hypothetical protein
MPLMEALDVFMEMKSWCMGNPPENRFRNGAAKPGQRQVQAGNTWRLLYRELPAVLFMAADAL